MNIDYLLDTFDYNDGTLFWKRVNNHCYSVKPGDKAGSINSSGALCVKVDGKNYLNHRIIFAMHHGYVPEFVDHADGDRLNNKIENLRDATKTENGQNAKKSKANTSGVKGVDMHNGLWRARVVVKGSSKLIGHFRDINAAEKAVKEFREKSHKQFARHE
jgi:hypothetical protein